MVRINAAFAVTAVTFAFGTPSAMHIELVSSVPAADTVLTTPPSDLLLTFSADLDFARSAVTLRSPTGTPIALGEPRATDDPRQLSVAIADDMSAGTYMVSWTAAPKDDHGGRGRFRFEVQ